MCMYNANTDTVRDVSIRILNRKKKHRGNEQCGYRATEITQASRYKNK